MSIFYFQKINRQILLLCLSVLFLAFTAEAQQNPLSWSLDSDAKGQPLKAGQNFKARLSATIEEGWHLYALDQPKGGPIATKITVPEDSVFKIDGSIESPKPTIKLDPNFLIEEKPIETKFFEKQATFVIPIKMAGDGSGSDLAINVYYQACNDTYCLPPKTYKISFTGFEEVKKTFKDSTSNQAANTAAPPSSSTPGSPNSSSSTLTTSTENVNYENSSIWSFLWIAISLGALSLLTPCVFPMIPITVSYFTNHSSHNRAKAIKLATVYSLGIIATFTLLGMVLAIFVGAAGINLFAANPWVNIVITAIFLFFAFNLFGSYEITVPTKYLTSLDNLTRSKEGEGSGIVGALLMGLTFTLTSFTCTSPFVGTILVSASQGSWQKPLIGMLAYSTVFALPFFVLALAPQLVSQLPRAGGWMNSVKVSMGFLEVAAAMKFISNVDLIWHWGIFTRPVVLAIWIAISLILSIYLLGKFQLAHDSKPERIGAFRLVSAILSLAIGFYLLTGLFGAKLGTLESFLPLDTENSSSKFFGGKSEPLKWVENDYEKALAQAKAEKKPVFVDFTGYTCTNCRWMEANIFTKKEVEDGLGKFVLARLYTDDGSENNERQQQFQEKTFQNVALPFYAIFSPDGKTVATFPGLTRNTQEFVDFLKKGQEN